MNVKYLIFSVSMIALRLCAMQEHSPIFSTHQAKKVRIDQLSAHNIDLALQHEQRMAIKKNRTAPKCQDAYTGPQVWDIYNTSLYLNENAFALSDQEAFSIDIYTAQAPFAKIASLESPDMPHGLPGLSQNNSNQLASVAAQSILLWDVQKYQKLAQLKGHTNLITSVCYDPANSSQLISGSDDGTIKVWDTRSVECTQTLQAQGAVMSIDVQPGGTDQVASIISDKNQSLVVWSLAMNGQLATRSGESTVKYNHSGSSLLTTIPGGILLYDGSTFTLKTPLQLPGNWSAAGAHVMAADFTADDSSVVLSGTDYNIFVCDGSLKEVTANVDSGMMGVDVHFNSNASQILSSAFGAPYDAGPSVRIWSVEELRKKAAPLLAGYEKFSLKCTLQ
jgi:WD40 repeat protein